MDCSKIIFPGGGWSMIFKSIYAEELSLYYELRSKSLSTSAIKHEACYLKRFDLYLYEHLHDKGSISEVVISEWIKTVKGKSSSVENEIIVIRQFLRFLQTSGINTFIPVIPKVHEDYVPYIFSDEELEKIFKAADNISIKDKKADPAIIIEFPVIIRLLYCCGLRIGETVKLRLSDVDLESGILYMYNTKNDKHRLVPVSNEMRLILQKYCMACGLLNKKDGWLFPSLKNEGYISDRAIKRKFDAILKANDIRLPNRKKYERGPCLHCFRHVFAFKSFAQAELDGRHLDDAIPYLSIYLGHDSLNETAKYLKFSNEMFPDAIDSFGDYMEDLMLEVDYEA